MSVESIKRSTFFIRLGYLFMREAVLILVVVSGIVHRASPHRPTPTSLDVALPMVRLWRGIQCSPAIFRLRGQNWRLSVAKVSKPKPKVRPTAGKLVKGSRVVLGPRNWPSPLLGIWS